MNCPKCNHNMEHHYGFEGSSAKTNMPCNICGRDALDQLFALARFDNIESFEIAVKLKEQIREMIK